jgi:TolA-binding protein
MKRGLYKDAARILQNQVKGKPDVEVPTKHLMLAECFYMMKKFAEARPYYQKARDNLPEGGNRKVAEYRLACVAFRLKDSEGARQRIDEFVRDYPSDRRAGPLMLFKMQIIAREGTKFQPELEAAHKEIQKNKRRFGYAVTVAADNVLTDFYVEHGQEAKAKQLYMSIVHGFRNVINQYAAQGRRMPRGLEKAHDNAAMQLGVIALKAKNLIDAARWLENVRYDATLKRKAKLVLAQVAYQKKDFNRAIGYLTGGGFIDTVPAGAMKSDMYLLLGLCEKAKPKSNAGKVLEYLEKVGEGSRGFQQAQSAIGDVQLARENLLEALEAYEKCVSSPKYEQNALYSIGKLAMKLAAPEKDETKQKALYTKAAQNLSKLSMKYPSSTLVKQSSENIDALLSMGYEVNVVTTDREKVMRWQKTAKENAGTVAAARALINLARHHNKAVMDKKMTKFLRAPNFAECAKACDALLDEKVYTGNGLDAAEWKSIRVEAHYYRGVSHLASDSPSKNVKGNIQPNYLKEPKLSIAMSDLQTAKELVDTKRLDLVKSIELALLETMFKSEEEDNIKKAQARYEELAGDYGNDVRFQKLGMDIAGWYQRKGRLAEAAGVYRGIAERATVLTQEETLQLLYLAGQLFSRAAHEARNDPGQTRFGIYIYPKEIIKTAVIRRSYSPFRKKIRVRWPRGAQTITGEIALRVVSKASGMPFVWAESSVPESAHVYLKNKQVRFKRLTGTVDSFLQQILDFKTYKMEFDIGITNREPTLKIDPTRVEPDVVIIKTIEIFNPANAHNRFEPTTRKYGTFRNVHKGNAMMFNVVAHFEEVTKCKVLWAEGVEKDDVLAAEYKAVPGIADTQNLTCADTLNRLLEPLDLKFKIVPRNKSVELYDQGKDAFNEIRKVNPKSEFGEKSLFQLAINFYQQRDYERMKIVLKEYLKMFDNPSYANYYGAFFWVGWVFEHERNFREATKNFTRAASERLVIYKPDADEESKSRKQLKQMLSYETAFSLEEVVSGEFEDRRLDEDFLDFIRVNSNVDIRLDESANGIEVPINREPFENVQVFDVLCDAIEPLGLSFRPENVSPKIAQKAYYRMASSYKKDGRMDEALTSINALFNRYPNSQRKRDAYKLKLEIHKGLKDYRSVLATLEEMKLELGDDLEAYKVDYELAWIYFDLCQYKRSAEHFRLSMAGTEDLDERFKIREGYAKALFKATELKDALHQYHMLSMEEPVKLRAFIDRMMVWYLKRATGMESSTNLPKEAGELMRWYESLNENEVQAVDQNTVAKVTWIYFVSAMVDLTFKDTQAAIKKFEATGNSPDDWLAGEASYQLALLYMKTKQLKKAKDTLEFLLFTTRSAESEVKGTYALGLCLSNLGDAERAKRRYEAVVQRFPDSYYADRARQKLGLKKEPEEGTKEEGKR